MKKLMTALVILALSALLVLPFTLLASAAESDLTKGYVISEDGYTSRWVGSSITNFSYGAWVKSDGEWNGCFQWASNKDKVILDSKTGVLTFPDGLNFNCKIYPAQTATPIAKGGVFFSLDVFYTAPNANDAENTNSNFSGMIITDNASNGDRNLLCITNLGAVYTNRYNMTGAPLFQLEEGWNTVVLYIIPKMDNGSVCNTVYLNIGNDTNIIPDTMGITQDDMDTYFYSYDYSNGKYFSELGSMLYMKPYTNNTNSSVDNLSIRNAIIKNLEGGNSTNNYIPSAEENLYKVVYSGYPDIMSAYVPVAGGTITIVEAYDESGQVIHGWKNANTTDAKTYYFGTNVYITENMILQADPNAGHVYDNACDTTCNVCGQTRTVPDHVYDNVCDTTCNECNALREANNHLFDNACDTACNVCGQTRVVPDHVYDNACDTTCNECNALREANNHLFDNACDTACNECGATRTVPDHVYDNACDASCNECGATRETGAHAYSNDCDTTCNECGATRRVPDHVYDSRCDATCNECGEMRTVSDHYYSNDCDTTCNFCQEVREVTGHVYSNACDVSCNKCYEEREVGEHIYDNACDPICNICEKERAVAGHQYDNDCDRICDKCETERDVPAHTYDNLCDAYCNECGFEREVSDHVDENKDQSCDVCRVYVPKKGLSTGAVVGISVGATAAVSGGSFTLLWFVLKKKRI